MHWLFDAEIWAALITLAGLEIVLGVDNIVFLTIMANKLPHEQRARARLVGLAGACFTRLLLLFSIVWLARLTAPLFQVLGRGISGRDLVLLGGGLFLLAKSTFEIHEQVEATHQTADAALGRALASFASVVVQIMVVDIVFSLDSVITAVGMTQNVPVMAAAIVLAVAVMMFFSGPVSVFVDRHPTIRILALAFLILIGMTLIGDGLGFHVPKGYIYFAMAFSIGVELVNLRLRAAPARDLPPPGDSSGV